MMRTVAAVFAAVTLYVAATWMMSELFMGLRVFGMGG